MDKALIILAPGGLGNQLFAVAAALHISEKNNQYILLISDNRELVSAFRKKRINEGSQHRIRIVYSRKASLWLNQLSSRLLILSRKFPTLEKFFARKFPTVQIPWQFPNDLLEKPNSNFWILRGYFQDINLMRDLSSSNKQFFARLFEVGTTSAFSGEDGVPNLLGLHIRRGDYLSIPSYGVLSTPYFHRLISLYGRENTLVMVASDDSSILEQFIATGSEVLLDARTYSPLETMKKLGKSDIFLMSNSTFSFWIGWIVNMRGGLVVKPNPWFKASEVPENFLLMDNFIEFPSEFEE